MKTVTKINSYRDAVEQEQASAWRERYQWNVNRAVALGAPSRNAVASYYGMNSANFRWAYGTPMDVDYGTVIH